MSAPIQQSLPFEVPVRLERPSQLGQAVVEYSPVRDILTRASGFMGEYDYTLNPYSGCSFGCTYCYAAFISLPLRRSAMLIENNRFNLPAPEERNVNRKQPIQSPRSGGAEC